MNEIQRRRLWLQILIGTAAFLTLAMAVALAIGTGTAVIVVLAAGPVVAVGVVALMVYDRRRHGPMVPPSLEGLDPDERRIVAATANSGARADDPRLAPAVIAAARRQQRAMLVLVGFGLLSLVSSVGGRVAGDGLRPFDAILVAFWLVAAAFAGRYIMRARRAINANRPDLI